MRRRVQVAVERVKSFECALATEKARITATVKGSLHQQIVNLVSGF